MQSYAETTSLPRLWWNPNTIDLIWFDLMWLPFAFFERLWSKWPGANFGSNNMVVSSLFSGQNAQSTRMPCPNLSCNQASNDRKPIPVQMLVETRLFSLLGSSCRIHLTIDGQGVARPYRTRQSAEHFTGGGGSIIKQAVNWRPRLPTTRRSTKKYLHQHQQQ